MKQRLVESNAARLRQIETGEQIVVGVNRFVETETSPLSPARGAGIQTVPEGVEREQIEQLQAWRASPRRRRRRAHARGAARRRRREGRNIMEPSIACAKAGVTTGEWGETLRRGLRRIPRADGRRRNRRAPARRGLDEVRAELSSAVSAKLGRRLKFLVGKPGLDGHSNGAEQIAVRARDCGMEVVYEGIRLTPAQIVNAALEESVHVVGLSILSGSHVPLVREIMERMRAAGLERYSGGGWRHHSGRGREDAEGGGRRGDVHAEGFPAQRHHDGDRRAR